MNNIAIKVDGLSKAYRIGSKEEKAKTFVAATMNLAKAPLRNFKRLKSLNTFNINGDSQDILWALKDVSFEVKQGEVVGFIGHNGAGKSTLLKVLSRITEPTNGTVEIRGRVSSLLEVGTGFHPELTGRDNVYMNGTILGMKRTEIERKFDEIVDFSGVERFLDTPVKRYSSGMKVRLAFAVAAHLEPEILIVDEVLAVGDTEFQKKCLGKMQDVAGGGRTVLFVSHNLGAVQNLCSRGLALNNGKVVDDGPAEQIVRAYLSSLTKSESDAFSMDNPDRTGNGKVRFTNGNILNKHQEPTQVVIAGEPITFQFDYQAQIEVKDLNFKFTVFNNSGIPVTTINTALQGFPSQSNGLPGKIFCHIKKNPFALGEYYTAIGIIYHGEIIDYIPCAFNFTVTGSVFFGTAKVPNKHLGMIYIDHKWSFSGKQNDVGDGLL